MTIYVHCDLCENMVEYPLSPDCGWYGVSIYRMGKKKSRGTTNKVKGVTTVCPDCFKKLSFLKVE